MRGPLRIAILECDTPPPRTHIIHQGYAGTFFSLFEAAADSMYDEGLSRESLTLSAWDVVTKQEYPRIEDVDAVLISGSKYDSFTSEPWKLKLLDFTKQILAQNRVRLMGVCFGHQMIARAMGCKVGRSNKGWETAVHTFPLGEAGRKLFKKDELSIMEMHRDIVYNVPRDVEILGSSARCHIQGMYKKNKLLTTQGHPEFDDEIMIELLNMRANQGLFGMEHYYQSIKHVNDAHDGLLIAQTHLRFLRELDD